MNFLKKILLVAVFAGNAEGMAPVLDFDTIFTPGQQIPASFQPEWNNTGVANTNAPNDGSEYIYFTIIPAGGVPVGGPTALVPLNRRRGGAFGRAARVPQAGEHNIYFPLNGHQPTTPEAVKYSCANVGNDLNSPITEWYMKMFGGD